MSNSMLINYDEKGFVLIAKCGKDIKVLDGDEKVSCRETLKWFSENWGSIYNIIEEIPTVTIVSDTQFTKISMKDFIFDLLLPSLV